MLGVADRPGPGELCLAGCIKQAPIGADAAFVGLPRLVDRLDDIVVDTQSVGTSDEVADDLRLLDASGHCGMKIVTSARPAELRDDDPFTGKCKAQFLVTLYGDVNCLSGRLLAPIGQNVYRNEVDSGGQLAGVVGPLGISLFALFLRHRGITFGEPYVPGLAGRDRYRDLAFDAVDHLDELVGRHIATQDSL